MEKANIFNDFFSRQCQPMFIDSTLPLTFSFETTDESSNIIPEKIWKIIETSGHNKAHRHDDISLND